MKFRRNRSRSQAARREGPFFASPGHEQLPRTGAPFFHGGGGLKQSVDKKDDVAAQADDERDQAASQPDDRERAEQTGSEREEAAQGASARELETASQESAERDDEQAAQKSEDQEDRRPNQESAERDEAAAGQQLRQSTAAPPNIRTSPGKAVRRITSSRFTGERRFEAAVNNRRSIRRGDRGDHVFPIQQALVELGYQLPGVGVDGRFGPETARAVRAFQSAHALRTDGVIGPETMAALDRQTHVPSWGAARGLRDRLRALISDAKPYADLRATIRAASIAERMLARIDVNFLREIQGSLSWNAFARIVELLGGAAPEASVLVSDPAVQAALSDAWTDSNPALTAWNVDHPGDARHLHCSPSLSLRSTSATSGTHEEGGWIYYNIITGGIYTRRARSGAQAALNIGRPPEVPDSIVVGVFHTHPNLGLCWEAAPGADDQRVGRMAGVPVIARGAPGGGTDFIAPAPSPSRRGHLAGPRGFPMGLGPAPQPATRDGGGAPRTAGTAV